MEKERHEEALRRIDEGIQQAAAITIEDGINFAIERGYMTIEEGEKCLESYINTFLKGQQQS